MPSRVAATEPRTAVGKFSVDAPRNEIGYLTAAFNDLTERRALMEEQRKAMVSDVARELRTPLSNIRSWLEDGQDGIAVPDQAFMNSLLAEALQLQHIIDDLQDLAAADAGALRLHPEPLTYATCWTMSPGPTGLGRTPPVSAWTSTPKETSR